MTVECLSILSILASTSAKARQRGGKSESIADAKRRRWLQIQAAYDTTLGQWCPWTWIPESRQLEIPLGISDQKRPNLPAAFGVVQRTPQGVHGLLCSRV